MGPKAGPMVAQENFINGCTSKAKGLPFSVTTTALSRLPFPLPADWPTDRLLSKSALTGSPLQDSFIRTGRKALMRSADWPQSRANSATLPSRNRLPFSTVWDKANTTASQYSAEATGGPFSWAKTPSNSGNP